MTKKYNFNKKSNAFSKETVLSKLEHYITFEKRFSPINIHATLAGARHLLSRYEISSWDTGTAEHIETDMHSRGLAPKTIINRLHDYELLAASQGITLHISKPRRVKVQRDYLSIAEARAMLNAAANPRDRCAVGLLLLTGCRASELCGVLAADVDVQQRTMLIRNGTKNYAERKVYLTHEAIGCLVEWLGVRPTDGDPQLLLTVYAKRLHPRRLHAIVSKAAKQAGINNKAVYPHLLRHTFACTALRSGIPITEVSLALGHTNLASTYIYLKSDGETLRDMLDKKMTY